MKAFVSDSRGIIAGLETRLQAARDEAAKLGDSGCPLGSDATCNFLLAAVAASNDILMLEQTITDVKAQHRAEYEGLKAAENAIQAEYDALGDPYNELKDLDAQETELRALADLAPDLAAAEVKIAEIDSAIAEARVVPADADARIAEIDAERRSLEPAVKVHREAQDCILQNERLADTLSIRMTAAVRAEALEPQVARLREECDALTQKIAKATAEVEETWARVPKEDAKTEGLRLIVNSCREKVNDCARQRGAVAAKLETIAEAEVQITELRQEVEDIAAALNDYTTLAHAFGVDGIQYMIIRGIVPEIMRSCLNNKAAAELSVLRQLSRGRYWPDKTILPRRGRSFNGHRKGNASEGGNKVHFTMYGHR